MRATVGEDDPRHRGPGRLDVRAARPVAAPRRPPLVLTHGWPGSIIEFLDLLGPLTDPPAHGGDAADAFHVVCPPPPGYEFSDKPSRLGWGVERIADAWAELMAGLGYDRYGAAGTDWGTTISSLLARRHAARRRHPGRAAPGRARPGHPRPPHGRRAPPWPTSTSACDGSAYSEVHATRPQTIGYGLVDSPVALCAWVAEKLVAWTDGPDGRTPALSPDQVLDDVMLYWLPGTGASSARLYWESIRLVSGWFTDTTTDIDVPTGCSIFPAEVPVPVPSLGRTPVHRHPPLARTRPRRPLPRPGATRPVRRRAPRPFRLVR